jgi:hypothetical protein
MMYEALVQILRSPENWATGMFERIIWISVGVQGI